MGPDVEQRVASRTGAPPKLVLQGRYQLERKLGAGGMSTVYLARDLRFGTIERWCAVKEIVNTGPDSNTRRLNLENFAREANILASLAHHGIPKVYDFFSQDDKSYLVLEFIDGVDLEELWAKTKEPLATTDVVNWALQICDVLSYLHTHNPPVIFRDVKPSNIMLTNQQRVMLIDFGIARLFQSGPKGTMIGTEGYAPPEQYRGILDPRGDVYALGATMHHLLSGRDPRLEAPFTFHERPLAATNPTISPALAEAIDKTVQYDADKRFASARELSSALVRSMGGSTALAPKDTAPIDTAPVGAASVSAPTIARKDTAFSLGNVERAKLIWRFQCEDEVRSSPRIADALVVVGCYDHNLYALDAVSGKFAWKTPTDGGISSTPLVTPQAIYIGSEDHALYALHPKNGQPLWKIRTRGPIRSSPRIHEGLLVIGSDDGGVYGISLEDQTILWRFQALQCVRSSALVVNETAIIGCDDGNVYGIQLRDGRQRWKYNAGRFVVSSPAHHDGLVIFGSGDWAVHAIDVRSGWAIWRERTDGPLISSPAIADGKVYVGSSDGHMYCFEARSGRVAWKTPVGSQIASSPCVTAEAVYFGSEDGSVTALERRTGKPRWVYKTGGVVASSPVTHAGRVYVGSADHHVYALPM